MANNNSNPPEYEQIKRDIKFSVLIGPFSFIIPIISYAIIYPVILSNSSIEVLGIWSLFVTTASFFSLFDFGFSLHIMREAGIDKNSNDLALIKKEYLTARRVYLFIGSIIFVIVIILSKTIFSSASDIYPFSGLLLSALIFITSTTILLISSLNAALLSARADNYFVKIVRGLSSLFTYPIAVVGALFNHPIEGFAFGSLFSSLFLLIIYQKRINRIFDAWILLRDPLSLSESFNTLKKLFKKGWRLYSVSIGMMIRQPVLRYVIAFGIGLPEVGIFDIAMRITATSREIIASGFSALFPSFSYLYRKNENLRIINIIRLSLLMLFPLGVIILVVLTYYSDYIYSVWLGKVPDGLVYTTQLLAIWQLITIINIPFWNLLQATHNEKIAAFSIWIHTFSILLLVPLSLFQFHFTLSIILTYWILTSLITQSLIYYFIEKKLSLLFKVFLEKKLVIYFFISIIYLALTIILKSLIVTTSIASDAIILTFTIILLFILSFTYVPLLRKEFTKTINTDSL